MNQLPERRAAPPPAAARERVIEDLTRHFALDHLGVEELERRLDVAQRAATLEEARSALDGLPMLPERAESAPAAADVPAPSPGGRQRELVVSIMGGTERAGGWRPAPQVLAMALMGGTELDFREAQLAAGVTDVYVFGFMGGVDIVVPPDLPVEIEGMGILGGFDHPREARHPAAPGVPEPWRGAPRLLRIRGVAIMGGVAISVRLPGESPKDARRRRKLEAQRRREGGGA